MFIVTDIITTNIQFYSYKSRKQTKFIQIGELIAHNCIHIERHITINYIMKIMNGEFVETMQDIEEIQNQCYQQFCRYKYVNCAVITYILLTLVFNFSKLIF